MWCDAVLLEQDTERLASYGLRSERRIDELESGIERLRNHQECLRRKLKTQADNKTRLEVCGHVRVM